MKISDICRRSIVTCRREDSVAHAARAMREQFTEDVVVTETVGGRPRPVGIVTFRDMVVRVVAAGLDAERTPVSEVMSAALDTVLETDLVYSAIGRMRQHRISRLVVIDPQAALVGVLTSRDIAEFLAAELAEVSRVARDRQMLLPTAQERCA